MKRPATYQHVTQALACALLAVAYTLIGLWLPALILVLAGLGWALSTRRRLETLKSFIFVCFVIAAGLAALLSAPPTLLVAAVVSALAAWDLDHFARRTRDVRILTNPAQIERAHLLRLLLVCGLGLVLAETALLVKVRLSFTLEFFLAALALIGVARLASWLQKKTPAERE